MNFDRYTDRSKGFVQSGQSLALREGHQQFSPEHLLKVLLDDEEGLASGLIDRAGGRSREALAGVERALAKRPKVSGGSGQVYVSPEIARVFDGAEKIFLHFHSQRTNALTLCIVCGTSIAASCF